jgi:hypothetical protein
MIFSLLTQTFLLAGYARHSLRPTGAQATLERSDRIIYLTGLGLLLGTYLVISFIGATLTQGPPLLSHWPLLLIAALAALAFFGLRRGLRLPPRQLKALGQFFSLAWLVEFSRWLYRLIRQAVNFISMILESEAGILWAFLLLALLLTVFFGVSASTGGGQ